MIPLSTAAQSLALLARLLSAARDAPLLCAEQPDALPRQQQQLLIAALTSHNASHIGASACSCPESRLATRAVLLIVLHRFDKAASVLGWHRAVF